MRRLPRLALLLLCIAYVLPGFLGREPWKAADMSSFGYMFELARGTTDWLAPTLLGHPPEFEALLPYWLGAWAIQALVPLGVSAGLAVRGLYAALLALTLAATWQAIYQLARRPQAQPVAFAFGGEADPRDYARALADAGLLALIATLGLAQFSHETTPSLAQLAFTALTFYGLAALPGRLLWPLVATFAGVIGLALSGAPTLAVLFAGGGALLLLAPDGAREEARDRRRILAAGLVVGSGIAAAALASGLQVWRWRLLELVHDWRPSLRLLVWFTWPAGPVALWTLWRWRHRLASRHVALPLGLAAISLVATLTAANPDRSLLLGLPALAALAAFALPTLQRSVSALIDWFTLLFFSGCALVIWVVWISLQTGVPAKPAANVAKLAPGFDPVFSPLAFAAALAGTLAWAALVRWRAGRHRAALWKSLVLPAGGATLCWLLLMTLWLPVLDYARSYVPSVHAIVRHTGRGACVEVAGLARGQMAALRYHGALALREASAQPQCRWRVLPADAAFDAGALGMDRWRLVATVRRPTDARDNLRVYRALP